MAFDSQASEGLVHIYCGEGKGKTTAAVGLCARAAGSGKRVLFVQFFKDGTSSENASLRLLPNVHTMHEPRYFGRVSNMGKEEFEECKRAYSALFEAAIARAAEGFDLLVLDEAVSSCNHGVISEGALVRFLKGRPARLEVVLTGREPSAALVEVADYVTEMKKIKHPFDAGIVARRGIEF